MLRALEVTGKTALLTAGTTLIVKAVDVLSADLPVGAGMLVAGGALAVIGIYALEREIVGLAVKALGR